MTTPRGGRTAKDVIITDGFNKSKRGSLSQKALKNVARQQERDPKAGTFGGKRNIGTGQKKGWKEKAAAGAMDDLRSAQQMLLDLRYAYRNAKGSDGKLKGRARLLELMKTDSEFKYMVKELLKIEVGLMQAKIKKEEGNSGGSGGGNQQNFFVVLKGLEEAPQMKIAAGDKSIDMRQIERAMNPDQNSYEPEGDEDENRDKPAEIVKPLEGVEAW